ncbi:MAG: DUF5017 domain-containing protein [Pedobacter sp.]|uniref:DUF5017 domain-containing protein n=1 Tax=Pedobacter sp. TaxID=1411316 RepID=UPI003569BF96
MKKIYQILILGIIGFSACKKEQEVSNPDFQVSSKKLTYKAGDTVVFNLSGDPDILSFYSGERTSDYDFLKEDLVFSATTALSFRTTKYAGNNPDCATLKYSTDFNGTYDIASIRQANWIDISDRFHLASTLGTSAVYENSGEQDISDLFPAADKPIHFAWFFTTKQNSSRTRYQVERFEIRGLVENEEDLSGVKYNFVNCAFKMVEGEGFLIQNSTAQYPRVTSTYIYWDGVFANTSFKEGWAVSAPIYSAEKINLGPAIATGIKGVSDIPLTSYSYAYKKPGKYKVVFVAANANIYERKEVVKELEITIEP